jgi:hypothetical protein
MRRRIALSEVPGEGLSGGPTQKTTTAGKDIAEIRNNLDKTSHLIDRLLTDIQEAMTDCGIRGGFFGGSPDLTPRGQ